MRHHNRRLFNEEKETKKMVIISLSVLMIAILAFIITFVIYSNYLNKSEDIAQFKGSSITELGRTNEESSYQEASSSIGKNVNEMQEGANEIEENKVEKIAINTSNMQKETVNEVEKQASNHTIENTNTIQSQEQAKPQPKKEEKVADPTFTKPVEGQILTEFAKDTLIYSNTLQEWVTHNGIDIKADKTTVVKASAEGTVKSIKNDPRYGITVVIEHVNGYSTVYANLLTAEFVKETEKVKQGQTIGTVGNTATFEIADESHLHFEMLKNGEYINPSLYLK